MKKSLALLTCTLLELATLANPVVRHNVYFAENSSELSTDVRHILDTVFQKLPVGNEMHISAAGKINSETSMYKASDVHYNRAQAIYDYYIGKGVSSENLEMIDKTLKKRGSYFSTGTYAQGDLEVRVYKKLEERDPVFTSLSDYYPQYKQVFKIDPSRENTIRGDQGTIITFPENAFECIDSEITVELMEFYSYSDLLKADLHTMSNGWMLETGGTINVIAKCGGNETQLADGKQITMEFPLKRDYKEGMQTFLGTGEGENFDWEASDVEPMVTVCDTYYVENPEPPYDLRMSVSCEDIPESEAAMRETEGFWGEGDWDESWYDKEMAANDEALDKYILSSDELGWINCDRFIDEPNTTDFVVSLDTSHHASVRMVFKNIKSVMSGFKNDKGEIQFSGIPVGERVTLIAYSIKDDVPYMAIKEIRITKGGYDELRLGKTTKHIMESQLMALK